MSFRVVPALMVACVLATPAVATPDANASTPVRVQIHEPKPGTPVRNRVDQAPIRGNAVAQGERPLDIDVMIVIDVSGSTAEPSLVDVDGDGYFGFNPRDELTAEPYPPNVKNTDPGDSILAAEVAAANALVETLDSSRVRVGVVSFAGAFNPDGGKKVDPNQKDAWLHCPLTNDYNRVRSAMQELLLKGPWGGTNFGAGVNLGVRELIGMFDSKSVPRDDSKKIIMFLTDGTPTLPIDPVDISDPGDIDFALSAARVAHQAKVTINVYAMGRAAISAKRNESDDQRGFQRRTAFFAAKEMADITLGTYTPVPRIGDVITYLQGASFANVDDVIFTNLTTSEVSEDVRLSPDGSFSGFVPVREGTNRVRVTALATDGSVGTAEFDLEFEKSGLSGRELTLELERIRKRNKELQLLIESERIKRFRAQARKGLKIEVEE